MKESTEEDHKKPIVDNLPTLPSVDISIIIPAYNEALRIGPTLEAITAFMSHSQLSYELIVVDDGSTDATITAVHSISQYHEEISILPLRENSGKGYATQQGVGCADGALILFLDADGSTEFGDVSKLISEIEKGADLAIGSRACAQGETTLETLFHRKLLGRIFNLMVNLVAVPSIRDTQCGFKLFTRQSAKFLFPKLTSRGFSFDVELLLIAHKMEMNISEVSVNWKNIEGSKVNLITDSIKMLVDIFQFKARHSTLAKLEWETFNEE